MSSEIAVLRIVKEQVVGGVAKGWTLGIILDFFFLYIYCTFCFLSLL